MPIVRNCIVSLKKFGYIVQQIQQEHISNIDDFVWRLCVNYIPLNQISKTKPITYTIPCYNSASSCLPDLWWWSVDVFI